ncbi:glycine betaine ABC transporter substrate-binding protein [Salirhabdus sp. Marseille-P4669]|uniref:glycine betaine ABC transporter substrate-binding protein n=1 Tax=Salirhabdus sp. Marseille-P4669 TaxID=2042310 RepID=UPI000C7AEADD|nr:glycine betaine ABC transporter substrate-binding protein [Salirhabdus sp. Marseille-P4669]
MFKLKHLGLTAFVLMLMVLAACGSEEGSEDANTNENEGDSVDYSAEMEYTITAIEPGAGVVAATETAVEEYENLSGWEVATSSSGAMATALGDAIDNEEPIVVTGWTPHWKFAKYDLKYLEDPKGVFGEAETINTFVKEGLEEEKPNAYKILDQFNWTTADMEAVMLDISNGMSEEEASQKWVDENQEKVAEWIEGTEKVDGTKIELVYVLWDSEIASTNVVARVLEAQGFDVTITSVENSAMWQAVATGDVDGMVAAWLPATHEAQLAEFGDQMVDLGPNLEGAKIGLVVPAYMDIDSIEDLKPAE